MRDKLIEKLTPLTKVNDQTSERYFDVVELDAVIDVVMRVVDGKETVNEQGGFISSTGDLTKGGQK